MAGGEPTKSKASNNINAINSNLGEEINNTNEGFEIIGQILKGMLLCACIILLPVFLFFGGELLDNILGNDK